MSLLDGADQIFLSLSSVTSLLSRFHLCGSRAPLLVSRQPAGGVTIGCGGCHTRVEGVCDELAALLRRRRGELQDTLGLGAAAQESLLAVLRGDEAETDARRGCEEQQAGPGPDPGNVGNKKTKAVYKTARCEVCSKVFYKRSNLRVHMLRHLGVRPHWCQKCGKSFSDPSTYSRHVASVCGEQRHLTCHVCGKAFYHQVHLKEHLRKHTGEKPYSCQECGKRYACQGSLRRHRAGQCPGDGAAGTHVCTVCRKAFRRPEALAAHSRLHAGVTLPRQAMQVVGGLGAVTSEVQVSRGQAVGVMPPAPGSGTMSTGSALLEVAVSQVMAAHHGMVAAGSGQTPGVGMSHHLPAPVGGPSPGLVEAHHLPAPVGGPPPGLVEAHHLPAPVGGPPPGLVEAHHLPAPVRGEAPGLAESHHLPAPVGGEAGLADGARPDDGVARPGVSAPAPDRTCGGPVEVVTARLLPAVDVAQVKTEMFRLHA